MVKPLDDVGEWPAVVTSATALLLQQPHIVFKYHLRTCRSCSSCSSVGSFACSVGSAADVPPAFSLFLPLSFWHHHHHHHQTPKDAQDFEITFSLKQLHLITISITWF